MSKFLGVEVTDIASPSLRFQKSTPYESKRGGSKDDGQYLNAILESAKVCLSSTDYEAWYFRYHRCCEQLGGDMDFPATTQWRAVVGWSTNPALEKGITLHHLLGVPMFPGSTVKGLLHAVAEREILTDQAAIANETSVVSAMGRKEFTAFLVRCWRVLHLFGSVSSTEGADNKEYPDRRPGLLDVLSRWHRELARCENREAREEAVLAALAALTGEAGAVGGALRCFDALPVPRKKGEYLELDVLTVHHKKYYSGNGNVPNDTENPVPIKFLAIPAGTTFQFRLGVRDLAPPLPPAGLPNLQSSIQRWNQQEHRRVVEGWLKEGWTNWGLGAKTAAGYGYFEEGHGSHGRSTAGSRESGSTVASRSTDVPPPADELESRADRILDEVKGDQQKLAERIDKVRKEETREFQAAFARRLKVKCPEYVQQKIMPGRKRKMRERRQWLQEQLGEEQS